MHVQQSNSTWWGREQIDEGYLDRPGCGIPQCTDRVALDLLGDLVQHVDFLHTRITSDLQMQQTRQISIRVSDNAGHI